MTVYHEDWLDEYLASPEGLAWMEQFEIDASYGWPWEDLCLTN